MGMSGRGGLPQQLNLRRAFCTPHSAFRAWQALQFQGFGGESAGGFDGADVFGAQSVNPGGGQRELLALDALHCLRTGAECLRINQYPVLI